MNSTIMEEFQESLGACFSSSLGDILGSKVREEVFHLLERNGFRGSEISARFDDTVSALSKALGSGARVLIYKTLTALFEQYSIRSTFGFNDSLREQLWVRDRVVADHLRPRRSQRSTTRLTPLL
jgi:hypothetical protein